jgi:hypothetical protein
VFEECIICAPLLWPKAKVEPKESDAHENSHDHASLLGIPADQQNMISAVRSLDLLASGAT